MKEKFKKLELFDKLHIHSGVDTEDNRINKDLPQGEKKSWSMCYGHLEMLRYFYYRTCDDYGILCEDDIIIHKDFKKNVDFIIKDFEIMKLDLLLIGYLCDNSIVAYSNFPKKEETNLYLTNFGFSYFGYPDNTWGTQMYLISRKQAKILLNKYNNCYADESYVDKTMTIFSSDWTLTKNGNRALIYPPIAIEDGKSQYDDYGQMHSRNSCYNFCFKKNMFI